MEILLGIFSAKAGKENIVKLTTVNEILHEISHDNAIRVVKFATSKELSQTYKVPKSQHQ
jgi:hypothetical protein